MNLRRSFAYMLILFTIGTVIYLNIFKLGGFTEPRSPQVQPSRKPFIYLTETEQCLPPNLVNSSQIGDPDTCNCEVIVLRFHAKCQEDNGSHVSYLFDSNTHFASGRNVLFWAAMDRRSGYHYYTFINDDTVLKYNKLTPQEMKKLSPFRVVEEWLLDYEPAVGVLNYEVHNGADVVIKRKKHLCSLNKTSLVFPTVFYDAIFNAFHYKAIEHLLPYPTQYEHECWYSSHRNTMIAVEVKFSGQAFMFAPVTAGNPLHRDYPKSLTNMNEIMFEFIERIRKETAVKLRNYVLFKQLKQDTDFHLTKGSQSFCVNVTHHQPIVPYRHFLLTNL